MNISFDWDCYLQYKAFLDEVALAMQKRGHKVGIITGEREKKGNPMGTKTIDMKSEILGSLGFKPDFLHLWGETETIGNGALWKAQRMDEENVLVHFDDDATELKKYTDRWVVKLMLNGQEAKF